MKQKKLSKKLVLNKERISRLNDHHLAIVHGGAVPSGYATCEGSCPDTCERSECFECGPFPTTDPNG